MWIQVDMAVNQFLLFWIFPQNYLCVLPGWWLATFRARNWREWDRSYSIFYDPALEVIRCHFLHILLCRSWKFSSAQSLSGVQVCDPMHCSMLGFPVHQLLELAQTHVHWVSDAIQPSHPLIRFSSHLQSFPASGSFPTSQFFASGGQSIGASASASVFPMNIQGWFLDCL